MHRDSGDELRNKLYNDRYQAVDATHHLLVGPRLDGLGGKVGNSVITVQRKQEAVLLTRVQGVSANCSRFLN